MIDDNFEFEIVFGRSSQKAFPLWHGEAVTDEGADFGLGLLYAGRFRRLRAASVASFLV